MNKHFDDLVVRIGAYFGERIEQLIEKLKWGVLNDK
jgi:hypothetical protein